MSTLDGQAMKARGAGVSLSPHGNVPGEQALGEVLEFMRLLWAVAHQLSTTSKEMEGSLGVTGLQRLVLRLVGQSPGITAARLSRILHLNSSTLTGVLKRMEQKGYVAKRDDPRDARRALLFVTQKGRELDGPDSDSVEAAVERLLRRASEEHLAATRELLTALADELRTPDGAGEPGSSAPTS